MMFQTGISLLDKVANPRFQLLQKWPRVKVYLRLKTTVQLATRLVDFPPPLRGPKDFKTVPVRESKTPDGTEKRDAVLRGNGRSRVFDSPQDSLRVLNQPAGWADN